MSSAAVAQRDYDLTSASSIVRYAALLGVLEAVFVVLLAFITRLTGGLVEAIVGGLVLLAGVMLVAMLPGLWTRARTIEGIAGAAGIGLAATVVFLVIDVALLQPFGVYTNRWREIGGGSNWWYHPVWWMVGTYLPWMGAWILANQADRNGRVSAPALVGTTVVCTVIVAVIAVLLHFPGAGWNLTTFGVALLPGLALATILSGMGSRST